MTRLAAAGGRYAGREHRIGLFTDLLRLLVLSSAALAAWTQPAEAAVRFLLIFLLLMGTRAIRAPRPFDAALALMLLATGWASAANWYVEHAWVDIPIHFALTGSTAAMLYFGLLHLDLLPSPRRLTVGRGAGVVVLPVTLLGGTAAAIWEIYEWLAETYLPSRIAVGYADTIGDMANGMVGSVVAGLVLAWWLRDGHRLHGALPRARWQNPTGGSRTS